MWDVAVHACGTLQYTHAECRSTHVEPLRDIWVHTYNRSDHCGCKCCWGNKTNTKYHTEPKQCKRTMSDKVQLRGTRAECLSACPARSFLLSPVPYMELQFFSRKGIWSFGKWNRFFIVGIQFREEVIHPHGNENYFFIHLQMQLVASKQQNKNDVRESFQLGWEFLRETDFYCDRQSSFQPGKKIKKIKKN